MLIFSQFFMILLLVLNDALLLPPIFYIVINDLILIFLFKGYSEHPSTVWAVSLHFQLLYVPEGIFLWCTYERIWAWVAWTQEGTLLSIWLSHFWFASITHDVEAHKCWPSQPPRRGQLSIYLQKICFEDWCEIGLES